jgi:UDP-2,3-diacylglucosamine hydrolase
MKAIFLSDTHLKGPGDAAYGKLMHFLDRLQGRGGTDGGDRTADLFTVDHLVIAGDFFDFWFGRDDAIYPGFQPVVEKLVVLKKSGIRISICEGNHDFFLMDYFSRKLGMDVYPDGADFHLDDLRIFVSHGDTVDRANRKYLALRSFLRSPFARGLQLRLPLALLWLVARFSSEISKGISGESQDSLAEVMYRFALGKFQEGYDAVILGHCHKPILREVQSGGRQKTFVALGDWVDHNSYLFYNDGCFIMKSFQSDG